MIDGHTPISWTCACRPSMEPLSNHSLHPFDSKTKTATGTYPWIKPMFIDTLFKVMPDFFWRRDTCGTLGRTLFNRFFALFCPGHSIQFPFIDAPILKIQHAQWQMPGILYMYVYIYMYIHVLIYIYIFLTWQCLQSLHLYFLICSRANYHDPHFMTNFTFLGIPGVCWCSSCLHQSHHSVQSHMVKLPWGWWGWLTLRDFGMYRIQQSTNSNICFEHVVKYVE